MVELEHIDARLDTLTTELYYTRISRFTRRRARMGGFYMFPSPSPSLEASEDEDADDGANDDDDEDEDASSSGDEEMIAS